MDSVYLYPAWQLYNLAGLALIALAALLLGRGRERLSGRLAEAAAAAFAVATVPILVLISGWLAAAALSAQISLIVIAMRLYFRRLHPDFLKRSSVGPAIVLTALSWLVSAMWQAGYGKTLNNLLQIVFLITALAAALWFLWRLRRYVARSPADNLQLPRPLPTVSIAIPARNETQALRPCLESALASDYPKLEILVYDDCSQDGTSDIVRSFASRGVRFIAGDRPAADWIGKNLAMQELQAAASGQYLMFMGADSRVAPTDISRIISLMSLEGLDMVSVVPVRSDGLRVSTALQQLRYFWQMVLPLKLIGGAPVASPLWCVKAATLRALGGFAASKHKIVPESGFAARLLRNRQYRMLIGSPPLGVTTQKKWSSQAETAIRLLYPLYKRKPTAVLAAAAALAALLSPYLVLLLAALGGVQVPLWQLWLAAAGAAGITAAYTVYLRITTPKAWWTGLFMAGPLLAQDIVLSFVSMLLYEFGEVNWKGRNICYAAIKRPSSKAALSQRLRAGSSAG